MKIDYEKLNENIALVGIVAFVFWILGSITHVLMVAIPSARIFWICGAYVLIRINIKRAKGLS